MGRAEAEYAAYRSIVEETAGRADPAAFRGALFEQLLHAFPESPVVGLCHRLNGVLRCCISQLSEAEFADRFPLSLREHREWLDGPMPPVAVATTFVPAAVRAESETFTAL